MKVRGRAGFVQGSRKVAEGAVKVFHEKKIFRRSENARQHFEGDLGGARMWKGFFAIRMLSDYKLPLK